MVGTWISFLCNEAGHFARDCPKRKGNGDDDGDTRSVQSGKRSKSGGSRSVRTPWYGGHKKAFLMMEMDEEDEEMANRRKMDWVELYVVWSCIRSNVVSIWGRVDVTSGSSEESALCFNSNELRSSLFR